MQPRDNAVEVINELGKEHVIYLISARFNMHYELTMNWLNKYSIKSKDVIFTEGKSKIDVCKKIGIDIFIEDSILNTLEIIKLGIPVLLYRTDYNKTLNGDRIIQCESWLDIKDKIKTSHLIPSEISTAIV